MDMKISGAGVLGGGEYDEVKISGSAKIEGSIRCRSFLCSGAIKGEGDLSCQEEFRSSGSSHVGGSIRAGSVHTSGALKCGALQGETEVLLSGGTAVEGKLSGGSIRSSGSLKVGDGIEAENFRNSGKLVCNGLLNAEHVEIDLGMEPSSVTAIGGGSVRVLLRPEGHIFVGFGFSRGGRTARSELTVTESIEADEVELEQTVCPLVSGRRVVIGPGCRIDAVRYSESIEVSPEAQVGRQEKL